MGSKPIKPVKKAMHRLNTRVPFEVDAYVKSEVKKLNRGRDDEFGISEGEVYRELLEEAIAARKRIR